MIYAWTILECFDSLNHMHIYVYCNKHEWLKIDITDVFLQK